jgi:hypothetical protein
MKYECVFKDPFIKELNAKLYELDHKTPFGAFQKAFRAEHCGTLNPYGSDTCPYPRDDCALAYYADAVKTLETARTSRIGLFRKITRTHAAIRADDKPLARETIRTNGQEDAARPVERGDGAGPRLRTRRPRSIGDLFGGDDL